MMVKKFYNNAAEILSAALLWVNSITPCDLARVGEEITKEVSKKFWPVVGIIGFNVAFGVAFAQAIPVGAPDFSDAELATIRRMEIAFVLGTITQGFASLFFNKTRPWTRWFAQSVLAGAAAAALIGVTRDSLNVHLQIGGETALGSLTGWIGVEAGFGRVGQIFKQLFTAVINSFVKTLGPTEKDGGQQ